METMNTEFALWCALVELAKIDDQRREIKERAMSLDSEIVEQTKAMDASIEHIFDIAKEYAPDAFNKYVQHIGEVMAESGHP